MRSLALCSLTDKSSRRRWWPTHSLVGSAEFRRLRRHSSRLLPPLSLTSQKVADPRVRSRRAFNNSTRSPPPILRMSLKRIFVFPIHQDAIHRTWLALGERLLRELQLQAARRVSERRNLLLAEGGAGTGRTLAGSLQHHQATLFARL